MRNEIPGNEVVDVIYTINALFMICNCATSFPGYFFSSGDLVRRTLETRLATRGLALEQQTSRQNNVRISKMIENDPNNAANVFVCSF